MTFQYSATDALLVTSELGTVTVTVTGQNDAPMAGVDAATTDENSTLSVDVLANDSDPDAGDTPANFILSSIDSVSVSGLSIDPVLPVGVITAVGDQVVFVPGTTFDELVSGASATVSVSYSMSDDEGASSSSTLTLTVNGEAEASSNIAPTAVADVGTTSENSSASFAVLANDTDPDVGDDPSSFSLDRIDAVTVSGLSIDPSLPASVIAQSGNDIRFSPGTAFDELDVSQSATVSVSYTMSDDEGASSSSTLTLTVAGLNESSVIELDNASPGFSVAAGAWGSSSYTVGYVGTDYRTALGTNQSAQFTPNIVTPGTYEVFANWTDGPNRATNARYEVNHANGTTTILVDQTTGGGVFQSLGIFSFNAGTAGNITLTTAGTDGYVIADAVRLVAHV